MFFSYEQEMAAMFLGKLLLVAVVFKSVTCQGVTDVSEEGHDLSASFNAATVPGWLGKLDNPLVLAAFPAAARVAADLQSNGLGSGGCPQGPPCGNGKGNGKATGNKHTVSARGPWPTPARLCVVLSKLLCVLCPSVREGFFVALTCPVRFSAFITVAIHALKPGLCATDVGWVFIEYDHPQCQ